MLEWRTQQRKGAGAQDKEDVRMVNTTKQRIVAASAEMFRRRGYEGTGLKQIVAEAGAPFGSLYHFFPGGKEELGAEVLRVSGAAYAAIAVAIFDASPDIVTGVRNFFAGAGAHLRESGWADACPIATVALEISSTSEPLRLAAVDVFERWISDLAARFVVAGIPPKRARDLSLATLSLLEGAFIFGRAMRSTHPVDAAGAAAVAAVQAALRDAGVSPTKRLSPARAWLAK